MPEISRFLGIVIGMFYSEHGVPHFHAVYGEYESSIEIETGVIRGELPPRAQKLVLEWVALHKAELLENWQLARVGSRSRLSIPWNRLMDYHVIEARHVRGHTLWLRFRDGTEGEIDLASQLRGPVMEPLRDVAFFKQFEIHSEFHTAIWANGADFAPEFLHDNVQVTA